MHDSHLKFARESLPKRDDVRPSALQRWVNYVSSLDALRSNDRYALIFGWV